MSQERHGVAYDLLGAQCDSWDRGIARLTIELGDALVANHRGAVHSLRASPRRGLTPPLQRLLPTGLVERSEREPLDADGRRPAIFHVASPFESQRSIDEVLPPWARSRDVVRVATVYDLIPMLFPEQYLGNPAAAAWYRSRLVLLRMMDHLLTISDHTRQDVIDQLGLPPERCTAVHTGVDPGWRLARETPGPIAFELLRQQLPKLKRDFVFYVGGPDSRKNVPGVVEAWLRAGRAGRAGAQLVVGGNLGMAQHTEVEAMRRDGGLTEDELLLTGYIDEDSLARLYRCCKVFVFPSHYEGAGLPMLEAMAAGAVVIGANNSSIREILVDDDAMFDATDPSDIAAVITRHLTDAGARARRREHAELIGPEYTWHRVADRTAEVYASITADRADRRWRPARTRPRPGQRLVVVASTSPAEASAPHVREICGELAVASGLPIDLVTDRRGAEPLGVRTVPLPVFEARRRAGHHVNDTVIAFSGTGPAGALAWDASAFADVGVLMTSSLLDAAARAALVRGDAGRGLRQLLCAQEPQFVERYGADVAALARYGPEQGVRLLRPWSSALKTLLVTASPIADSLVFDGVARTASLLPLPVMPLQRANEMSATVIVASTGVQLSQLREWAAAARTAGTGPVTVVADVAPSEVAADDVVAPIEADLRALVAGAASLVTLDAVTPSAPSPLLADAAAAGVRTIAVGRGAAIAEADGVIVLAPEHLQRKAMEDALRAPLPRVTVARPSVAEFAAELLSYVGASAR